MPSKIREYEVPLGLLRLLRTGNSSVAKRNTPHFMLRFFLAFTILLFTGNDLTAQRWASMLHEGRANFYEIQDAFEADWSGMDTVRGSGWKPYKRWEFDTEERVYPSGEFPPRHQVYSEYYKFMETKGRAPEVQSRSNGNWEELGPKNWQGIGGWNPGNGRVNFIYEEPGNPNTIYLGTPAGGLWRTEDSGQNWSPLTDQLPSMGVSGIAVDPNNSDIIYIATGDRDANDYNGVGVLKSTDYGETWQTTGMAWNISDGVKSNWLIMHPNDSQTLYLASNDGLYKSTDGADSWQLLLTGNIREVALHPENAEIVYAVTNRFYRSENGGNNFSTISDGLAPSSEINRLSLAVTPAMPDYVYVLAGDDNTSGYRGMYRSTDSGLTFTEQSDSPNILGYSSDGSSEGGQSWYDLALAASPTNGNRVITGGINVWRSNDGGSSYSPISHWVYPTDIGYTHADIHFIRYYGNRLYCGSDGGVFVSEDNGTTWNDLSAGIGITQLYRMDFSELDPYNILVGTQDNGTNILSDSTFFHVLGGDGNGAAVNNDNPDILYASYPYGSLEISNDGGDSFSGLSNEIEENGLWVTPFVLDPSDQNILYAGYQNIWRHTQTDGWEQISQTGGAPFRTLSIAPSDNNYIYGSKSNDIYRTTDGGENWEVLSDHLPNLNITEIAINPGSPEHIIVTLSGYSNGEKVFESFNAGDDFENVSYNLPNIPVNCATFDETAENGIYIGTDAGVFFTSNELASWVDYMEGLPKTKVRQLKISQAADKIRAGTYGRGIWESDLYSPSGLPPEAQFSSDVTILCVGDSVQFTDQSYNAAPGWTWTFEGGDPVVSNERDPIVYYFTEGIYSVTLEVQNPNGSDFHTVTNYVYVFGDGLIPPYSESFEMIDALEDNQWIVNNPDNDVAWQLNQSVGYESSQSAWIDNFQNSTGRIDELPSEAYDLTDAGDVYISFKVAYAQRNELNNDRLRLYISNDCGESWTIRGQWKGLTTLPTAPPTSEPFVPTQESDWQEIMVPNVTSTFFGPNFRFMFEFLNDNGNNIYIDDINLHMSPVGIEENKSVVSSFEMFPNPARGQTTIEFALSEPSNVSYHLLDASGRTLRESSFGQQPEGTHRHTIHTYELAKGMYIMRLQVDGESLTRKLFIE